MSRKPKNRRARRENRNNKNRNQNKNQQKRNKCCDKVAPAQNTSPVEEIKNDVAECKEEFCEPNDPVYDVEVDENGGYNVVSEASIDAVEFPPEVADFIAMLLVNIRTDLNIPEDADIPQEAINAYIVKSLQNADVVKIVKELKIGKYFGIEDDESYPTMPLLDCDGDGDGDGDDDDALDDDEDDYLNMFLSDEALKNLDFSKLELDEDGNKILATLALTSKKKPVGCIPFSFPVETDEEMKQNHVIIRINIPYIGSMPTKDVNDDTSKRYQGFDALVGEEMTYFLERGTFAELQDAIKKCKLKSTITTIDEGDNVQEKITEFYTNGQTVVNSGAEKKHKNGYDPETKEYWYDNRCYHEKDVIWFGIPATRNSIGNLKGFTANIDTFSLFSPCDITLAKGIKIKDGKRVLSKEEKAENTFYGRNNAFFEKLLPQEEIYYIARRCATMKNEVGYCVVCLNGQFNAPVESFYNPTTQQFEDLMVVFNSIPCLVTHHKCVCLIMADVGNMNMQTFLRYSAYGIFDWSKRVDQEIEAYRITNPRYSPYDDPYGYPPTDDFYNG